MAGSIHLALLGASQYPKAKELASPSFASSASGVLAYFEHLEPRPSIKNLFDTTLGPLEVDEELARWLASLPPGKVDGPRSDIFFYYIGHGLYFKGVDYCLSLNSTQEERVGSTSYRVIDLAHTMRRYRPANTRLFLILDCCYAGQALRYFMGDPRTAMLCSAAQAKKASSGTDRTLFSGTLLEVLRNGDQGEPAFISFGALATLVGNLIRTNPAGEIITPQVYCPDASEGDLSKEPIFRNPAYGGMDPELVVARRIKLNLSELDSNILHRLSLKDKEPRKLQPECRDDRRHAALPRSKIGGPRERGLYPIRRIGKDHSAKRALYPNPPWRKSAVGRRLHATPRSGVNALSTKFHGTRYPPPAVGA